MDIIVIELVRKLGIECKFIEKDFDNKLLEKLFVIDANLKRRHLNKFQRAGLALKEKPVIEELAKINREANLKQNHVNNNKIKSSSVRNLTVGRVDEQIGEKAGISRDTVRKVETILEKASEGLKEKLEAGKISINKAFKKLRKEERRQEIIINANSIASTSEANSNERFQLINNDFRQIKELRNNSIDLIFTDPPYAREYLPIYQDLAKVASKTLVENGSLITYAGNYAIPVIVQYMEAAGLEFYWLLTAKLKAPFARFHSRGIVIKQKPLLWFVKGCARNRKPIEYISDLIESETPDKDFHEWAQSPVEANHVISRLTLENQTVLDPMMGSGTTGLAALQLNRKFIGIEIDPQNFEIAKANLAEGDSYSSGFASRISK